MIENIALGVVQLIELKDIHLQEDTWREAFSKRKIYPRDINGWHLAIIYDVVKTNRKN